MNLSYQNEIDKARFQHDIAYGCFTDSPKRTAADKILHDKAFNVAKNPKFHGYHGGLVSMVDTFFDKKISVGAAKNEIMLNKELTVELHKPSIRKFEKRRVY